MLTSQLIRAQKDPGRALVRSACYKVGWKLLLFQLLGYPTDCKPGRSRFLDVQHNIIIYIYIYMMCIYIYNVYIYIMYIYIFIHIHVHTYTCTHIYI